MADDVACLHTLLATAAESICRPHKQTLQVRVLRRPSAGMIKTGHLAISVGTCISDDAVLCCKNGNESMRRRSVLVANLNAVYK